MAEKWKDLLSLLAHEMGQEQEDRGALVHLIGIPAVLLYGGAVADDAAGSVGVADDGERVAVGGIGAEVCFGNLPALSHAQPRFGRKRTLLPRSARGGS